MVNKISKRQVANSMFEFAKLAEPREFRKSRFDAQYCNQTQSLSNDDRIPDSLFDL